METGSLAQEAGRHWKPWTQGKGCDIMQAFSAASCLGTLYNTQQRKERSYGCASLWISCLDFDFGCMNGMTGNLLLLQNPKDTSHTQAAKVDCLHCWMANTYKYSFLKSCFMCNLCSSTKSLMRLGSQLLALSAMTFLWNSILLITSPVGAMSSNTDTDLLYVDVSTSFKNFELE